MVEKGEGPVAGAWAGALELAVDLASKPHCSTASRTSVDAVEELVCSTGSRTLVDAVDELVRTHVPNLMSEPVECRPSFHLVD